MTRHSVSLLASAPDLHFSNELSLWLPPVSTWLGSMPAVEPSLPPNTPLNNSVRIRMTMPPRPPPTTMPPGAPPPPPPEDTWEVSRETLSLKLMLGPPGGRYVDRAERAGT